MKIEYQKLQADGAAGVAGSRHYLGRLGDLGVLVIRDYSGQIALSTFPWGLVEPGSTDLATVVARAEALTAEFEADCEMLRRDLAEESAPIGLKARKRGRKKAATKATLKKPEGGDK
jgi:hypothetical protein